jgi:hypothetical protein
VVSEAPALDVSNVPVEVFACVSFGRNPCE